MSSNPPATGHASAYHNTDRSSARIMSQAAYQPSDAEYAEYERRAAARKAAKEAKAADKAAKKAASSDAGAAKPSDDDASSIFSVRSLASSAGLLRKSEK